MSLVRVPTPKKRKLIDRIKKLAEEFKNNGGKVTVIPAGKTTVGPNAKYRIRRQKPQKEQDD
tara:strand:+ start:64 stop:249 length:186 start_codon:yes stop_codon:yes gene_type:complete